MSLYLTAILPPKDLSEQIDDIRQELSDRYKIFAALKPPVHITLFRPVNIDESIEDNLVKLLKPETFPLIWDDLKNRKFKRTFSINRFTLLKHNGKRWEIFQEFPLQKQEDLLLF